MKPAGIDIATFTWRNLNADVYLGLHARPVRLYLDSVVTPALDAIEAMHAGLANSDDAASAFMRHDLEQMLRSSVEAFALAIQSLWERQLREFLKGCARELGRDEQFIASLAKADWTKLVKAFAELRGLPLEAFDSFDDLELLQLLGNACRHGDGPSAQRIYDRWPELWPLRSVLWLSPEPQHKKAATHPPFSQISVPRALLDRLAHAVIWFWEDHEYVYTNSLQDKHEGVTATLENLRERRARRPPRASIAAMRES